MYGNKCKSMMFLTALFNKLDRLAEGAANDFLRNHTRYILNYEVRKYQMTVLQNII